MFTRRFLAGNVPTDILYFLILSKQIKVTYFSESKSQS